MHRGGLEPTHCPSHITRYTWPNIRTPHIPHITNRLTFTAAEGSEILRKGDFGDEHVTIEDKLITSSLNMYEGAEREQVIDLFLTLAIFPEGELKFEPDASHTLTKADGLMRQIMSSDVPIPVALFDRFASKLFGGTGRRAALQVRTWLTALLRLSLCMGSLVDGVFQHDIVRDYAVSRCTDLQARQVRFMEALIDRRVRPEEGWPTLDVTDRG